MQVKTMLLSYLSTCLKIIICGMLRTQGIGGGTGGPHGPGPPLFNYEFCLVGLSNTISIGSIVEVNCLMKKCRYFVNIICKVAGFRNC